MTYNEFKDECYLIRENAIQKDLIRNSLKALEKNKFTGMTTVTDPSQNKIQRSSSRDDKLLDALDRYDKKRELLQRRIDNLPQENDVIKDALLNAGGPEGVLLSEYFIVGDKMVNISSTVNYSYQHCYRLIRSGLRKIYDQLSRNN